ncbi:glycosyl transferase [Pseudomassariella vexata]|uniref:Glycosyl transferase n=1 Tax=Pseudomassariella vexata TaxID=1141098 RepID=A0A1Y2DSL1_9PEZI|nr:glycosyl transferase [Pseudomassariella vexata]ORY62248.1 glycosyl transferase [Pseudomassariella vexata]
MMLTRRYSCKGLRAALGLGLSILLIVWLNPNWTDRSIHQVSGFDTKTFDLNDIDARHQLCRQHGWTAWKEKGLGKSPRKIFDLFMVNSELDWLEIRLNTTFDLVDYFVIVESPKTFTNLDKPMTIKNNLDKFAAYRDKIIYHELKIPEGFHSDRENPAWAWEDLQRNAMYDQVLPRLEHSQAPELGDVIIVADVDEIIRPETLVLLKSCNFPRRLNLRSSFYYYSFQFLHSGAQWIHPQATYYQGWRTILPVNLRNWDGGLQPLVKLETADLWNAGWHCSSCFSTIQEFLNKMSSFSHVWMNQEVYRDRDRIANYVRQGKDLWDREGEEFLRVENNEDIPPMLLDERDRFSYLVDRDGPSAGFRDYP